MPEGERPSSLRDSFDRLVREQVLPLLRRVQAEPTGRLAALTVFVVCALTSWILWVPLGLPGAILSGILPVGDCRVGQGIPGLIGVEPGNAQMYVCSAAVALLSLIGPIAIAVGLFALRGRIAAALRRWMPALPEETRFLVRPLVATLAFTLVWAGLHFQWAIGLVPQGVFPGVVGLFVFAVDRWNDALRARLARALDLRDRYPVRLRVVAALAVPLVISLLITFEPRVTRTALKEQIVILVSLATGYLLLVPRSGDLWGSARRFASELRVRR